MGTTEIRIEGKETRTKKNNIYIYIYRYTKQLTCKDWEKEREENNKNVDKI